MEICSCGNSSYAAVLKLTVYSCLVKNMSVTLKVEPVTDVIRKYEAKSTNSEVKLLMIHNQSRHQIPEKLGSFFPNVEGLEVMRSELKTITAASLGDFKNLKYLNIMKNKLENLPEGLFVNNMVLKIVIICCNNLKIISSNISIHCIISNTLISDVIFVCI